jgi:hypothetical protein
MIEESDYRFPRKEQEESKLKADPATLATLNELPWRPFDVEF